MSGFSITPPSALLNSRRSEKGSTETGRPRVEPRSSGLQIDTGESLSVADGTAARIRGGGQQLRKVQEGISLLQKAEEGASKVLEGLRGAREQIRSVIGETAQTPSEQDLQETLDEINQVAEEVQFNGTSLLAGSTTELELALPPEDGETTADRRFSVEAMDTESLGLSEVEVSSEATAREALTAVDGAISQVATTQASLQVERRQLETSVEFFAMSRQNEMAAESRVRDPDQAVESTRNASERIREAAGTSTLAQLGEIEGESALQLLG